MATGKYGIYVLKLGGQYGMKPSIIHTMPFRTLNNIYTFCTNFSWC